MVGMAKEPIENAKNEENVAPKPLKMKILAQYIRDMSFENILAQKLMRLYYTATFARNGQSVSPWHHRPSSGGYKHLLLKK